jgi:CO dehydrogenase nickel-insertion accessory protein CooC1
MGNPVKDYDYVVMDDEAGLGHLSRRATRSSEALKVSLNGGSLMGLKEDAAALKALRDLGEKIWQRSR